MFYQLLSRNIANEELATIWATIIRETRPLEREFANGRLAGHTWLLFLSRLEGPQLSAPSPQCDWFMWACRLQCYTVVAALIFTPRPTHSCRGLPGLQKVSVFLAFS